MILYKTFIHCMLGLTLGGMLSSLTSASAGKAAAHASHPSTSHPKNTSSSPTTTVAASDDLSEWMDLHSPLVLLIAQNSPSLPQLDKATHGAISKAKSNNTVLILVGQKHPKWFKNDPLLATLLWPFTILARFLNRTLRSTSRSVILALASLFFIDEFFTWQVIWKRLQCFFFTLIDSTKLAWMVQHVRDSIRITYHKSPSIVAFMFAMAAKPIKLLRKHLLYLLLEAEKEDRVGHSEHPQSMMTMAQTGSTGKSATRTHLSMNQRFVQVKRSRSKFDPGHSLSESNLKKKNTLFSSRNRNRNRNEHGHGHGMKSTKKPCNCGSKRKKHALTMATLGPHAMKFNDNNELGHHHHHHHPHHHHHHPHPHHHRSHPHHHHHQDHPHRVNLELELEDPTESYLTRSNDKLHRDSFLL